MTGALALPRVIFPSEGMQDLNADDDITRPDGFTLEQLGDKSVGYPLTKGNLGNLMTFKLNKYRHVNCDRLREIRSFGYALLGKIIQIRQKWAQVYTTDYKPTIGDVGAADQSNNFAARMGTSRVLAGNSAPTSPGVWASKIVLGRRCRGDQFCVQPMVAICLLRRVTASFNITCNLHMRRAVNPDCVRR